MNYLDDFLKFNILKDIYYSYIRFDIITNMVKSKFAEIIFLGIPLFDLFVSVYAPIPFQFGISYFNEDLKINIARCMIFSRV